MCNYNIFGIKEISLDLSVRVDIHFLEEKVFIKQVDSLEEAKNFLRSCSIGYLSEFISISIEENILQ